ncbi:MAG: protein kinase [Pyrinomonadaceae bacterium]
MIEAGKILQDRYRLEKQIGQGGMGTVFVATDQRFGSTVAIKQTFFEEENLNKAFEREGRLLNGLKHPALPKVSDYFSQEGSQFIVMEFIAGQDLSETMERSEEPFPVEKVLDWTDQLCDALNYLHNQEVPVIHRDIKPQNLKLTPNGQVILLDFGLAKGNPTDASHKTAAKSIFGYSRNYASLEQIQGTGTDPQSDLYSLAATIYHLLTGIPPADALTRAMNVLNGQVDPLIAANFINPKIPPGLAAVLQKSMALNSNERPATALELKELLDKADKTIPRGTQMPTSLSGFSTDLLAQETKLMSPATNLAAEPSVANKTGVLTGGMNSEDSVATRLMTDKKAPTTNAKDGQRDRKKIYIGAAALSGILAIGGLAFLIDRTPEDQVNAPSADSEVKKVNVPTGSSVDNTIGPENVAETEKADETAPAKTLEESSPAEAEVSKAPTEPGKKSQETAKTGQTAPKPGEKGESEPGAFVYNFEDEDGRVRVVGDRIETEEFIIDKDGIRPKDPSKHPRPVVVGRPVLPPEQFEKLTPKQKMKVLEILRLQERLKKTEKPLPPQPPPNEKPPANN